VKAHIKIPKGWRRLRVGAICTHRDKFCIGRYWFAAHRGAVVNEHVEVIRRIQPRKKGHK